MSWIKQEYKDWGTKALTYACAIGGPAWSGLSYLIDNSSDTWWQGWAFAWSFYAVIVFPALYFSRKK